MVTPNLSEQRMGSKSWATFLTAYDTGLNAVVNAAVRPQPDANDVMTMKLIVLQATDFDGEHSQQKATDAALMILKQLASGESLLTV